MKNVFKTSFFYLVAFSLVLGNSVINIDFSTAMAHAEELGIPLVKSVNNDKYTVCHATSSKSNPWERINVSKSSIGSHENNHGDIIMLDNENIAQCPDSEPEPSCVDADAEFVVDLQVMGENCGSQNIPAYDYEYINLTTGAGLYDVYTVVHRDGLDEDTDYGQDHEEFTLKVNSSVEGPVVLDQPAGSAWLVQNAGTFDFLDDINTVHMNTAFQCADSSSIDRNSVAVTKLCLYKKEIEEPKPATVIAHKIVCDEESDLPNWYNGADITADTAQNFVDANPSCHFEADWQFEWGTNDSLLSLNGDYIGEHNVDGWYDFDSLTDINGQAEVKLDVSELSSKTWFREVLSDGYIPFSFPPGEKTNNVSAEFWCNNDVVNYDNAEWIENIEADHTYYCVAFNVKTPTEAECGNYELEDGEECDEGPDGTDTCSAECTIIDEPIEECSDENNLIINYSFETPEVTNTSLWQKMSSVLGWVIEKTSDDSATTLELHRGWSNNVAANGLQYAELDGDQSTRISQDIATEEGAEYKLFWSFAGRHNIAAEQNNLGVNVDGVQVATNGPVVGNAPLAQTDWENSNYIFTATDINTAISFEDIGPSDSYGTFVDNIRLCKIADPEPSDNIPVITLIGSPIINVDHGSVYTDEGATADDVEDGNITPAIVTVNPVDTSVSGTYTITYNVTDSDSNNAVEVTRTVIVGAPYAPWCSVLLGAMKDFYNLDSGVYGKYNQVIDIYKDENNIINLSDIGKLAQMYYTGDNDVCYTQFEDPEDEYHFQCEDPEVGWCGGLVQGITDSVNRPDRYFEVFDIYKDDNLGVINLSDLGLLTQLSDPQECYTYYVPPFLMCENPEPYCGDGNVDEGEQCDAGPDGSSTCDTQCKIIPEPPCLGCGGGGGTTFAIRDLESAPSCSAFDISWRTTKNSDTILDLGTESGIYTININNDTNTKNHSLNFADLEANTTYYYQVRAISSNGREIKVSEKSFTTPPAEQCQEVLGEKIKADPEPLICDFLRASGSSGVDKDINGVFQYPNGSLLRDACDRGEAVYLIRDQKKWHVPTWQYLHDNYFGQRIYNVFTTVLDNYPDWTGEILGIKEYGDGTLLRGSNMKIYVLEKGHKKYINTLEKLAQYAGQEIINVNDEVLQRY